MALIKLTAQMQKCTSYGVLLQHADSLICRAFVTSTRPLQKQLVDKETCETVKKAAEAIAEGIKETRHTGQFVKDAVTTNAGKIITEMGKKAIEKAAEDSDADEKPKSVWQKVKEFVYGKGEGEGEGKGNAK